MDDRSARSDQGKQMGDMGKSHGVTVSPLVLASASPRRRELLEQAGYSILVRPTHVAEPDPEAFDCPLAYAVHTAWLKANASREDGWILAADTVAACHDKILGKPADRRDAQRILSILQGTEHQVITGLCLRIISNDLSLCCAVSTTVRMVSLSENQIGEYLDTGLWEGKAGAYGIQDHDDPFVEAVVGSYSNVMGLPMERLEELLQQAGSLCRRSLPR